MIKLASKTLWPKAAFLTALVAFLVAAACWGPNSDETTVEAAEVEVVGLPPVPAEAPPSHTSRIVIPPRPGEAPRVEVVATRQAEDVARAPIFTPYTVRPDITNRAEVARALEQEYPPLLREAGIGGTVHLWFFIDADGKVQKLQVKESSGHRALDDAALRVGGAVAFTPALNRDKAVPVWIALPITFTTDARAAAKPPAKETPWSAFKHFLAVSFDYFGEMFDRLLRSDASVKKADGVENATEASPVVLPPPPPGRESEISAAPTFTPYTVQPDIRNRSEVARALERAYPPLLRDAGIGGTAQVWFFIDDTGEVRKTQLQESSGHKALDEAALEVARTIQFTAAMNRDKPVSVWISLPITFTTR